MVSFSLPKFWNPPWLVKPNRGTLITSVDCRNAPKNTKPTKATRLMIYPINQPLNPKP